MSPATKQVALREQSDLTELRAELVRRGLSFDELAEVAGIQRKGLSRILHGTRHPSRLQRAWLVALVTPMGFDAEALWPAPRPLALTQLLKPHGLTPGGLAVLVGVSKSSVCNAAAGRRSPSAQLQAALSPHLKRLGIDPTAAWAPSDAMPDPTDRPHLQLVDSDQSIPAPTPAPSATAEDEMHVAPRDYLTPSELKKLGLSEDPFEDPTGPSDVFMPKWLQFIEDQIKRAVTRRRIVVLVGQPGAGKSTVLRRLGALAHQKRTWRLLSCSTLNRADITSSSLTRALLRDLTGRARAGLSNEAAGHALKLALEDANASGLHPVLVIDEAHLLTHKALVAIKQTWDSNVLYKQLSVVLVGQNGLHETLLRDVRVRELTGRTQILELPAYSPEDTKEYLTWRFARVGAESRLQALISDDGFKALAARAKHPLWINNLAIQALRYGLNVDVLPVDASHVGRS